MVAHTGQLRVASLCSGYGGLDLALRVACDARTVLYCEREISAARILAARMQDGTLDSAPIWSDLTTLDGLPWRGFVDAYCAGFPCQPHSCAGDRRGIDDERWIWPSINRLAGEIRPSLEFYENVDGLLTSGGFDRVLADLAERGLSAEWLCLRASDLGAPHERERVFVLAYTGSARLPIRETLGRDFRAGEGHAAQSGLFPPKWEGDAGVFRGLDDGTPAEMDISRADRIRAGGNGVVPIQAAAAFVELARRAGLWQ